MEAEESHDLPSASWRSREASVWFNPSLEVWVPKEPKVEVLVEGKEKMRCSRSSNEAEKRGEFLLPLLFSSV